MSAQDYTNGANLAEGVRVFDDLTRFENSGLECPVLVGDMGGGIGQARLRVLRDVFRGLIEADNAGFPTGGAVFIALRCGNTSMRPRSTSPRRSGRHGTRRPTPTP